MHHLLIRLLSPASSFYSSRPRHRGFGCSPRLLIGLFLALGAVGYYFFGTTEYENEFTGRRQRLALATTEEEVALGLQSAPTMIQQMGGLSRDSAARARVTQIGQRLIQGTLARQSPYRFEFHLLADRETVNAFALPGGQIFITEALYRLLDTEDKIAGVLAHEIGHVVGRHSNEQMAKSRLLGGLAQGAGVAMSDGYNTAGMYAAQQVAAMRMMKFSRDDELESDALGVRFLAESGYDPEAMIAVMEVLARAAQGRAPPEFLSTHPLPESRIERLRQLIRETKTRAR
jgi:predicted Zn-dependent protease